MDAYVRQFGTTFHDQFYTDSNIFSIFSSYVVEIVKRYTNTPELFAWYVLSWITVRDRLTMSGRELANDPRYFLYHPFRITLTRV